MLLTPVFLEMFMFESVYEGLCVSVGFLFPMCQTSKKETV